MSSTHQHGAVADNQIRKEQAKTRTEQDKTRTEQADTHTQQAGTRTEQAETRTKQDKTRAEQAETHTEQAKTRLMEQALRASELSYRRLFEAARDGILILDFDTGRITDVNPFLLDLLGLSRIELVGKTVGEISPFKDIASNQIMLQRIQQDGYVRYHDLPLETRDGRSIAVEFVSNVYQVGASQVIQCNIRDITERKRAEIASSQLAAIVEASDDAIIGKDMNRIITNWNKGAEKIFGYTASEMVGASVMRLIPADRQDEDSRVLDKIRRGGSVPHFDTQRQTKDGRLIDVSVSASPIKNLAGHAIGVSKVARDITERKAAETALRTSEARYRTLFENAPDGIVITDSKGNVVDANASMCQLLGYTRDELVAQASTFVTELGLQHVGQPLDAITSGSVRRRELQLRRKDDSLLEVETITAMMSDGNRMGMVRDITQRKEAENTIHQLNTELEQRVVERTAQLEAANRELEAFSYSVSHDLRAPLRAINGFAAIVLADCSAQLPEEGKRHLERIRNGGQQMGVLIDDLLAFSRLSRQSCNRQTVDMGRLVQGVLDESKPQRDARQIEVHIGELPACHGDPALLKQVWVNLIANAVKYTRGRESAIVEIGCARKNGEHQFFVRDNGAGFDMRYANKLFGVFQRLHRADEFEGTGVGLAIVQRIVHRHGGRVWAEAEVNRGATFHFTLEGQDKGSM